MRLVAKTGLDQQALNLHQSHRRALSLDEPSSVAMTRWWMYGSD